MTLSPAAVSSRLLTRKALPISKNLHMAGYQKKPIKLSPILQQNRFINIRLTRQLHITVK